MINAPQDWPIVRALLLGMIVSGQVLSPAAQPMEPCVGLDSAGNLVVNATVDGEVRIEGVPVVSTDSIPSLCPLYARGTLARRVNSRPAHTHGDSRNIIT